MSNKFDDYFSEAVWFSNCSLVTDGRIDKADAILRFIEYQGEPINHKKVVKGMVRFGFAPSDMADYEYTGYPMWFTCEGGRGAKPVWMYSDLWDDEEPSNQQ